MIDKVVAIWRFAVAILLYPLALAALIWIGWTGKPVWWAVLVLIGLLLIDRTWLFLAQRMIDLATGTKKRPRR